MQEEGEATYTVHRCVCVCIYIFCRVCVLCVHVCACVCMYIYMHTYIHTCIHAYMYVCTYAHIRMCAKAAQPDLSLQIVNFKHDKSVHLSFSSTALFQRNLFEIFVVYYQWSFING